MLFPTSLWKNSNLRPIVLETGFTIISMNIIYMGCVHYIKIYAT